MAIATLVPFKVGICRWTKENGWTKEFLIMDLKPDSMLEEITSDDSVTESFGLRFDMPGFNRATDYETLRDIMDEEDGKEWEEKWGYV